MYDREVVYFFKFIVGYQEYSLHVHVLTNELYYCNWSKFYVIADFLVVNNVIEVVGLFL